MERYWKAWGGLAGALVGLGAAYGVVPVELQTQIPVVFNTLLPVATTILGTILSPKNGN